MTALTLVIDWYHCHRATATFDGGGCHNLKKSIFYFFSIHRISLNTATATLIFASFEPR
jgi:hypothetical protein